MAGPWDEYKSGPPIIAPADPTIPLKISNMESEIANRGANQANAQASLGNTITNTRMDNVAKLRSEFNALPAVKDYRESFTQLMTALKAHPNAQGDTTLIYAYAKAMDPGSVVRESEMGMAQNTDTVMSRLRAKIEKQFGIEQGGDLSPAARKALKIELNNKVAQLGKGYGNARQWYQQLGKENGFDPEQVVGPSPATPFLKDYERLMHNLTADEKKAAPGIATSGKYSSPDDLRIAKMINSAAKGGASFDVLSQMSQDAGRGPLTEDHRKWIDARARGENVGDFPAAESGETSSIQSALGEFANTPMGSGTAAMLNSGGFGLPQLMAGDAPFDAMRDENPVASFTGDVMGGLTGTAAMAKGLAKAGLSAPRAATAANIGYGTLFGANTDEDNRLRGAGVGAGASLVGDTAGKYVLAPLATRALDTAPVQGGLNKARGMFGRPAASIPRPIDMAEAAIGDEASPRVDDILNTLGEASRLGLPFSLADADPALRQSLGSASRLAPDVRADVGRQIADRSLGQSDRALAAMDRSLVPPVSMSDTSNAIRTTARAKAAPLYDQALAMPAPDSPAINEILNSPAGQKAARNAYDIGLNNGASPADVAITTGPDGQQIFEGLPTYRSLDLVKKGFDQHLGDFRSPTTGKIDLEGNPLAQSIESMRQRLVSEMDAGNPIYKQARQTYAEAIKPREALDRGYKAAAPNVTQDQFGKMVAGLDAPQTDAFRSGFSTNLSDRINKTRLSANPYDVVAGTPDQQAKLSALFPGSPDFMRQRGLEQNMADTAREVLGGSPTAERLASDQRFTDGGFGPGDVAEGVMSFATGMPPVNAGMKVAKAASGGMFGRKADQRAADRARKAAPFLFNQDPVASANDLQKLLAEIAARRGYQDTIGRRLGLIGGGAAAGAAGGY